MEEGRRHRGVRSRRATPVRSRSPRVTTRHKIEAACAGTAFATSDSSHNTVGALRKRLGLLEGDAELIERKASRSTQTTREGHPTSGTNIYGITHLNSGLLGTLHLATMSHLTLSMMELPDGCLGRLRVCGALRKLSIVHCARLKNIAMLSALKSLEELSLRFSRHVKGVGGIEELPRLRVLDLSGTSVDCVSLRTVIKCTGLVRLILQSCENVVDCFELAIMKTLEELDLTGTHRLSAYAMNVLSLPRLIALRMDGTQVPPLTPLRCASTAITCLSIRYCRALRDARLVASMSALEELDFYCCQRLSQGVECLAVLPCLHSLNLGGTCIGDDALVALGNCPRVERLALASCKLLTDVSPIRNIGTLEELDLSNCRGVAKGIEQLGKLPRLAVLNLERTGLTNESLVRVCESKSIKKIVIDSCANVTDIRPLVQVKGLVDVSVRDCGVGELEACEFAELGSLRALALCHFESARCSVPSFRGLEHLVRLTIHKSNSPLNASVFACMKTLKELMLADSALCGDLGPLGVLPCLRILDAGNTKVTDCHLRSLSKSVSIVELYLRHCECTDDFLPLTRMRTLNVLHLVGFTAKALNVDKLNRLSSLSALRLKGDAVTDESLQELCNGLSLSSLDISGCSKLTDVSPLRQIKALEEINLHKCVKLISGVTCLLELPFLRRVTMPSERNYYSSGDEFHERGIAINY
ncbi:hypothetical protein ERJ75_001072000 [Trypanosoma vivax]|nr:hypothetical protein ERJ75_001072000 [Trypanosoma vivax]